MIDDIWYCPDMEGFNSISHSPSLCCLRSLLFKFFWFSEKPGPEDLNRSQQGTSVTWRPKRGGNLHAMKLVALNGVQNR